MGDSERTFLLFVLAVISPLLVQGVVGLGLLAFKFADFVRRKNHERTR